jgi:hypothetical protein
MVGGPWNARQDECAVAHAGVDPDEIAMIEDVEELATELEIDPLSEIELPINSKIRLPGTEPPEHVAAGGLKGVT